MLKFKTFIQFIIEDLGHDLDCSVTGKSLIFIFSLSSFLPFLLPFLSSSGFKKKNQHQEGSCGLQKAGALRRFEFKFQSSVNEDLLFHCSVHI